MKSASGSEAKSETQGANPQIKCAKCSGIACQVYRVLRDPKPRIISDARSLMLLQFPACPDGEMRVPVPRFVQASDSRQQDASGE